MITDRELDGLLAGAAGVADTDLPPLPEGFLPLVTADAGLALVVGGDGGAAEPASVLAARQLVADAWDARTAAGPRRRKPARRTLRRAATAVVAVAAAWTAVVVVWSGPSSPQDGAATSADQAPPPGGIQLVAAEEATFPLSLDPPPAGLVPAFSWWGGVPYYGEPSVFSADYLSPDGDRVLLQLFEDDPRDLPDVGWWDPEDLTETVDVGGAEAVLALDDSSAAVLWERPDGRWVGLAGEGTYADPAELVDVAETVVARPQPLGLQFGLAPAGWTVGGYEESRSLDLVNDAYPELPPLRLSLFGGPGFDATVDTPFEGMALAGPVEQVTVQGLPARMARTAGGEGDPTTWLVTGQLPGGHLFLLLAPEVLTRQQVLEIAEQVRYTP